MLKLIILIFTVSLATKSWAILGGVKVESESAKQKVVMFDTRVNDISIVCSGSFINKAKLITAAHCFDHLKEMDCLNENKCSAQKIIMNNKSYKFKVSIHPNYKSKRSIASYQTSSNYDIAVLELANTSVADYFKIDESELSSAEPLLFYGYGMTELRKKRMYEQTYYQELGRGNLLSGLVKNPKYKNGLILSSQSDLKLDKNNRAIASKGGQVLRSDSGGPLIMDGKIVGIIRNYQISDIMEEATEGASLGSLERALSIQSTFTVLSDQSTQKFLSSHK